MLFRSHTASNVTSCWSEISNIEQWATNNNLSSNREKSAEIVLVVPRSVHEWTLQPPNLQPSTIFSLERIDVIKALGFSRENALSLRTSMSFLREDIICRAYTETRHLPGHDYHQIDVCVSALVGLCKRCRSCPYQGFPSMMCPTWLQIGIIVTARKRL